MSLANPSGARAPSDGCSASASYRGFSLDLASYTLRDMISIVETLQDRFADSRKRAETALEDPAKASVPQEWKSAAALKRAEDVFTAALKSQDDGKESEASLKTLKGVVHSYRPLVLVATRQWRTPTQASGSAASSGAPTESAIPANFEVECDFHWSLDVAGSLMAHLASLSASFTVEQRAAYGSLQEAVLTMIDLKRTYIALGTDRQEGGWASRLTKAVAQWWFDKLTEAMKGAAKAFPEVKMTIDDQLP